MARAVVEPKRFGHALNVAWGLGPPLATFVAARLVLVAAAVHAHKGFPGAADLAHADAFNYLSIAAHGYILHPCPPHCVPGVSLPWTGNSGWFPLYPLVLAPFAHLGVGIAAGAVVAALCQFSTFALLWLGFVRGCRWPRAVGLMALAAVFPGAVYLSAVFPLSMLTLLFVSGLLLARRGNTRGVSGSAFLATLAYPLGLLFSASIVVAAGRRVSGAIAASIGALLVFVVGQRLMTGHWNAYSLSEKGRGLGLHDPLSPLLSAKASTLSFLHDPSRLDAVPALQTTLVGLIVVASVAATIRARHMVADRCILALVLLCWAEPLVLGGVSLYRTDVALIPAVALLRRLPTPVVAAFVAIAAPIAYWMSVLYLEGRLN